MTTDAGRVAGRHDPARRRPRRAADHRARLLDRAAARHPRRRRRGRGLVQHQRAGLGRRRHRLRQGRRPRHRVRRRRRHHRKGVFGAGVNVRYANIEVVEVDGLEGDDEFFVQSTAFGVAYRVIGGLGSDTINVTGDVVEDIVVKRARGPQRRGQPPRHLGRPALRRPRRRRHRPERRDADERQRDHHRDRRLHGRARGRRRSTIDKYFVRLAADPGAHIVYVTVSAGALAAGGGRRPRPARPTRATRSGSARARTTPPATTASPSSSATSSSTATRRRTCRSARSCSSSPATPSGNWNVDQAVYVYAVDDLRSEGDRVVAVSHSVISTDARYDGTLVRNVEVTVRDDDTPGVFVLQVEPGTTTEDGRTVVIEGDATTALTDELLVQLARRPGRGRHHRRAPAARRGQRGSRLDQQGRAGRRSSTRPRARSPSPAARPGLELPDPPPRDAARQRPAPGSAHGRDRVRVRLGRHLRRRHGYDFPSLYAPPARVAIEVLDDETAGAVVLESGGGTLVVFGGATDDYFIRLQRQPTAPVQVAILTDGLTDVSTINGNPFTYQAIGGYHADAALHRRRDARQRRLRPDHDHARRRRQLPRRGLRGRPVHPARRRRRG